MPPAVCNALPPGRRPCRTLPHRGCWAAARRSPVAAAARAGTRGPWLIGSEKAVRRGSPIGATLAMTQPPFQATQANLFHPTLPMPGPNPPTQPMARPGTRLPPSAALRPLLLLPYASPSMPTPCPQALTPTLGGPALARAVPHGAVGPSARGVASCMLHGPAWRFGPPTVQHSRGRGAAHGALGRLRFGIQEAAHGSASKRARCSTQRHGPPAVGGRHAACGMRHAACGMRHAACGM